MKKLALSILILTLFVSNYWICDYLYPGSEQSWDIFIPMDKLHHSIWACIIMISLYFSQIDYNGATFKVRGTVVDLDKLTRFIVNVTIGLSFSDVADRVIFGITSFTELDKILIPATIIIAAYHYVRSLRKK